jgi:hypothetical protein
LPRNCNLIINREPTIFHYGECLIKPKTKKSFGVFVLYGNLLAKRILNPNDYASGIACGLLGLTMMVGLPMGCVAVGKHFVPERPAVNACNNSGGAAGSFAVTSGCVKRPFIP